MPYIKKERREAIVGSYIKTKQGDLAFYRDGIVPDQICNAGDLNYAITELIIRYYLKKGKKYQSINDIVGALAGASSEFQRRVVNPYEDKKIKENGDVWLYEELKEYTDE